jgi:hypothetical protein
VIRPRGDPESCGADEVGVRIESPDVSFEFQGLNTGSNELGTYVR